MDLTSAKLLSDKLFVVWNWEWIEPGDDDSTDESSSPELPEVADEADSSEGESHNTSTPANAEDDETPALEPVQKHTVAFKCIGASRDPGCQEVLALAAKRMREGQSINVILCPEPHNKYDAKAIAFVIVENDISKRVGYVVREALDNVHEAMKKEEILKVEVKCIKYLLHWSRSGPGWYAAIDITKVGEWPAVVAKCSSTL